MLAAAMHFGEMGINGRLIQRKCSQTMMCIGSKKLYNPDNLEDYVKLREHSPVAISGGEVLTRRQSFLPWFKAHTLTSFSQMSQRSVVLVKNAGSPVSRRIMTFVSFHMDGILQSVSQQICTWLLPSLILIS